MEVKLTDADVDGLAKRIVEYLWKAIPTEAIPDPPKKVESAEPKQIKTAEPAKTAEPVKEEAAYTLEQVIKAVKEYTLKDKEGAMKLKPVLQSLGAEKLSLLPKEKLPEFIEGARKVGVEI